MIRMRRVATLMAGALVVGAVVGSAASGWAATKAVGSASQAAATAERPGAGLRLGSAMRDAGGSLAEVVAKLTGYSVTEVQARRAAGESFAQIAQSKDVTAEQVVDEALAVRKRVLDEQVDAGVLTREQADAALKRMEERLSARVTTTAAGCDGAGAGAGGGRGAGRGCGGGGGCGQAPATQ